MSRLMCICVHVFTKQAMLYKVVHILNGLHHFPVSAEWDVCNVVGKGQCSPTCCLTGVHVGDQMQIASGQCNALLMECR